VKTTDAAATGARSRDLTPDPTPSTPDPRVLDGGSHPPDGAAPLLDVEQAHITPRSRLS
jgi:hypothetical protein